ncbi:MAG: pantoate--beta-alanine ligase [Planctomycetia bacterium]|nr:pantoate--beta-alanine ligase [Planctomycetia bacterium]
MAEMVADPARIRRAVLDARAVGRRVGFVPTMGALHAGHASLAARAAAECDDVAVSIFVNPTQFGPGEDFDRYPRTLDADRRLLEGLGVRWIFVPEPAAIYPPGDSTRVVVEGPSQPFEGRVRPGHFTGVSTVVCRLLLAVPADAAYFGAKDWQQTVVVRRMVRDLGLPVDVVVCPTVRESDGLAMSSRNAYLSPPERARAIAIHEGLEAAARLWAAGAAVAAVERSIRDALVARDLTVDYASVVDPDTLEPAADPAAAAVALVAARVGSTRLIDNRLLPARRPAR